MNLRKISFILILSTLIFSAHTQAKRVKVTGKSIVVRVNGQDITLFDGDEFNIDNNVNGWATAITVTKRDGNNVRLNGSISDKNLAEYQTNGTLVPVIPSRGQFLVLRQVSVEASGKSLGPLPIGTVFEKVKDEGGRTFIKIISSENPRLKGREVYIWSQSFQDSRNSNAFLETIPGSNSASSSAPTTSVRPKLRPTPPPPKPALPAIDVTTSIQKTDAITELLQRLREEEIAEEERLLAQEVEVEQSSCPPENQTFEIKSTIYILGGKNTDSLPRGTVIKTRQSGDVCHIEVMKLPNNSRLNISDIANIVKTYPTNLNDGNIEPVKMEEDIDLAEGQVYKMQPDGALSVLSPRNSKYYPVKENREIEIVSTNPSRTRVRIAGKEYLIGTVTLSNAIHSEEIKLGANESFSNNVRSGVLTSSLRPRMRPDNLICDEHELESTTTPTDDFVVNVDDPIIWEQCGPKKYKYKKNGRWHTSTQDDSFLESRFPVNRQMAENLLGDERTHRLSKCIHRSLQNSNGRMAVPQCKRDANGNLINFAIRKKNGSKYKNSVHANHRKFVNACASRNLTLTLADSFNKAAKCLGADPFEVLPLINHESSFQPNIFSPTMAMGVGQMTLGTFKEFTNDIAAAKKHYKSESLRNYSQKLANTANYFQYEASSNKRLDRRKAHLMTFIMPKIQNPKPECYPLKYMVERNKSFKTQTDILKTESFRMCKPHNPDNDFLMAIIKYQRDKRLAMSILRSLDRSIPADKLKKLAVEVGRWMYNGGAGGINGSLSRFAKALNNGKVHQVNSKGRPTGKFVPRQGISNLSVSEFKKLFSYHLSHNYLVNTKNKLENAAYQAKKAHGVNSNQYKRAQRRVNNAQKRRLEVAHYVPGSNGSGGIDGDLRKIEQGESGLCGR